MLLPVLEVHVVHHCDDAESAKIARQVFAHFHGTSFSGLIGGAVEVYVRSGPWAEGVPRPIAFPDAPPPNGVPGSQIIAVVPVISVALARAVEQQPAWTAYVRRIVEAQTSHSARVGVFPVTADLEVDHDNRLSDLLQRYQRIGAPSGLGEPEPPEELRCRDLAQGIAQMIGGPAARLQVFLSHTRRIGAGEEEDVPTLIRLVQSIIGETRLRYFFDASDLQPGRDWADELRRQAASSALLALRTDLYASRIWCQREMLIAKRAGMPIVILDSLGRGEERGSFLMDHVPRIPVREAHGEWSKADIRRGLNLLVDECLKRSLWTVQQRLAEGQGRLDVAWWAPHAPEPVTLTHWMRNRVTDPSLTTAGTLRILHPDPPLGTDEYDALSEMVALMGHRGSLDVLTPRLLAARGA